MFGTVILSVDTFRFRVWVEAEAIANLAITLPCCMSLDDEIVVTACATSPYLEEFACVPRFNAEFVVLSLIEYAELPTVVPEVNLT